ncbi:MAG: GNAT family N-acetyltransferase [Planctomycetes bacterium]|nr:GNAT family N-acetyltransferase [Planctomycetota bacterium]
MEVRQVSTRHERDEFVRFPWQVQAADPHWAPPLLLERKAFIDPQQHPFYQHGSAAQFLAYRDGRPVGRIQASDDPRYNAEHYENVGCFGLFDCINDHEVAGELLRAAAAWLRARGRTIIRGPIDYSTNYASGLLIDGFDTPPRVMMNHNPPYYAELLQSWGLSKAKDLYAWWLNGSGDVLARWVGRADRLARRGGVTIRPARFADFEAELARCKQVYNQAWEQHWSFVKMTDAEFRHLANDLRRMAVPESILLAEVEGQPVGLCLTLPDVNEAIAPLDGRLTTWGLPIGLARLLWNMKRIKTARMAVLGVLPGFRRRGVAELLILRALTDGKHKLGYTGAELGWTLEDNDLINRTIESVGGERYKTYRIYERRL